MFSTNRTVLQIFYSLEESKSIDDEELKEITMIFILLCLFFCVFYITYSRILRNSDEIFIMYIPHNINY